jgi:hypothetical protein
MHDAISRSMIYLLYLLYDANYMDTRNSDRCSDHLETEQALNTYYLFQSVVNAPAKKSFRAGDLFPF